MSRTCLSVGLALTLCWCGTVAAQPANDLCENAIAVDVPSVTEGSTADATASDPAAPFCGTSNTAPDVWYKFTGTGGEVIVSLCGSSYDTKLSVYADGCATLTCVGGNDDSCGLQSEVTVASVADVEYLVLVHGYSSSAGDYTLTIDGAPPPPPCEGATAIAVGDTVTGDTTGAPAVPDLGCGSANNAHWYVTTGGCAEMTASLCGSTFDTKISIYQGDCVEGACVASNDDSCSLQSEVSWDPAPGATYYIQVFGFGTNVGEYTLALTAGDDVTPTNDECADAIAVSVPSSTLGTTIAANGPDFGAACGTAVSAPGVWYKAIGTGRTLTASTCGTADYDTKISVFTGACDDLVCVGGNDDGSGCPGFSSSYTWGAECGVEYLILVHGYNQSVGCFQLNLSAGPAANDLCAGAVAMTVGDTVSGSTNGATVDADAQAAAGCTDSITAPGVWYSFVSGGGDVLVSVCDAADYDTKLHVFSGGCDALVCEASNDDGDDCGNYTSELSLATTADTEYLVLVSGYGDDTGCFDLTVSGLIPPPANDTCGGIIEVTIPSTTAGTTSGATPDAFPACDIPAGEGGVLYSFTGTGNTTIVSTCGEGTTIDTTLHVYSGACGGIMQCVAANDDACEAQAELTFESDEGASYIVVVSGPVAADSAFELTVTEPAPANDEIDGAISVELNTTTLGLTTFATVDTPEIECSSPPTAPGLWYTFDSAPGSEAKAFVYTCDTDPEDENTPYDTKLTVWAVGVDGLECIGGNDDACGLQSGLGFVATPETTYFVLVHGFGSNTGAFELTVESELPPANDACDGAMPLDLVELPDSELLAASVPGSTIWAFDDAEPEDLTCGTSTGGGVWYSAVGTGAPMTASLCNSAGYDTRISVFSGVCGELVCVGENDDGEIPGDPDPIDCGLTSHIEWASEEGAVYYILVHGYASNVGDFDLTVTAELPPGGLQLPGDMNQDGNVDVSDGIALFGFLFLGSPESMPCGDGTVEHAANVTLMNWGDSDAEIDISDGIGLLQFLFGGGAPHVLGLECIRIPDCPEICVGEDI